MRRRSFLNCHGFLIIFYLCLTVVGTAIAQTPLLKIKTKHHDDPGEEQAKLQVMRLAQQYNLKKYTITRDILIERGVIPHSHPVLTLNLRFLDNDDLALSSYVHEQGHWVLTERGPRMNRPLLDELMRAFPGLDYRQPNGDGEEIGSYYHIAVCMLEWQATEVLIGPERARKVIEWKSHDHYKAIYAIDLAQRQAVEGILARNAVAW